MSMKPKIGMLPGTTFWTCAGLNLVGYGRGPISAYRCWLDLLTVHGPNPKSRSKPFPLRPVEVLTL